MEKIVPFKRDISFETKIAEIRSISLEHTYEIQNNLISETQVLMSILLNLKFHLTLVSIRGTN